MSPLDNPVSRGGSWWHSGGRSPIPGGV